MPTSTEREKRQLEEIAHLFLSGPCEERKTGPVPVPAQNPSPAASAGSVVPRTAGVVPFWIRPRAAPREQDWVEFFQLNLVVLFQLADEPVVWIPSRRQGLSRSESGLPARLKARLAGVASAGLPLSYCGPMGLRVLPWAAGRRTNWQRSEGTGQPNGWGAGSLAGYRYVLAEEPRGPLPWEALPCLEVWLVGSQPVLEPFPAAQERGGSESRFRCRSAFVVMGAAGEDEARQAGRRWKEAMGWAASCKDDPEYLGFVPGPLPLHAATGRQGMVVIESPLSWQTRSLQEIASRIRARRPLETAARHLSA